MRGGWDRTGCGNRVRPGRSPASVGRGDAAPGCGKTRAHRGGRSGTCRSDVRRWRQPGDAVEPDHQLELPVDLAIYTSPAFEAAYRCALAEGSARGAAGYAR